MTQRQRREYLIAALLAEDPRFRGIKTPESDDEAKQLLRALFNVRAPRPVDAEFLCIQDEYLRAETEAKGIVSIDDLTPVGERIYLWQGDITRLKCDAIVNAANSQMLGCFVPCHGCIDNAIHTYAGVQLRAECAKIMREQGHEEPTGRAKITAAYDLPCRYVLHTVGPIVRGRAPSKRDCELLASCYRSCLELAQEEGLHSIAFCCISTGEFGFPNEAAARIAVDTVSDFVAADDSGMEVIFDVYKDRDAQIYSSILGADAESAQRDR